MPLERNTIIKTIFSKLHSKQRVAQTLLRSAPTDISMKTVPRIVLDTEIKFDLLVNRENN